MTVHDPPAARVAPQVAAVPGYAPPLKVNGAAIAAPFTFKGGAYPGTAATCGATLAAGGSCTVIVTYSPVTVAVHTATLTLNYNDSIAAQTTSRNVQGTGVAPAVLAISDGPTYNYGVQPTGGATDKTFTITNSGGYQATGLSGGGLVAPFAFKGGSYPGTAGTCAASLNPAATCTV